MTSPFEGFSKLTLEQRQARLKEFAGLSHEEIEALGASGSSLTIDQAEHLIENVVGLFTLPLGIATHFNIDGRDVAIPMAVEETSIVAAASASAKWVRRNGGFKTRALGNLIIGQIQFPTVRDPEVFSNLVEANNAMLLTIANDTVPNLVARGGGIRELQVRRLARPDGETMAVLHLLCDPCDAMGANLINQVCEALKGPLEQLTGESVGLCILSNLVDTKLVEATCEISDITPELGIAIQEATLFANVDQYRGTTHNKGVMNGIDPVLIATGNDWRAVEAGIHSYMSLGGRYHSITEWKYEDGKLKGRFLAPIAVGTVGGVTRIHPSARVSLKILGVQHAEDLARICAATGLAQNLAALRALCSEGIVQGHMRLHAANLALAAGADKDEIPLVEQKLRQEARITLSRAKELLEQIRLAQAAALEDAAQLRG
ncbi:MAG: hydroxymethylglutaryl-CoA reductase, degradative [Deltaproteobacteria bacterium]|nr:hydroxymethylglutaryl-CoA reductase, degradative [Deltaproteobacteria bacterium]